MVFDPSQVNGTKENIPDDQPGGKYGYRIGHKKGKYQIPDVVLDECSKHVKVVTIGAGISGIFLSYLFQKHGKNLEHVVYEKNGDIGGTWLEVRKTDISKTSRRDLSGLTRNIEQIPGGSMRRPFARLYICLCPLSRLAKVPEPVRGYLSLPQQSGRLLRAEKIHDL